MADLQDVAAGGGLLGGGVALGVAAMRFVQEWITRRRSPEQRIGEAATAASDLIRLALDASGHSVEQLLTEQRALRRDFEELKVSHEACEQRCETLTGQLRQSEQRIDSLLRQLADPASTAPGGALRGAVLELADGSARVAIPGRGHGEGGKG